MPEGMNRPLTAVSNEFAMAVSTTPVGIPAADLVHASGLDALRAEIQVAATDAIRYTEDGTTPTAANGRLVAANGTFTVRGLTNLRNLRMIRVTADTAVTIQTYLA